MTLHEHNGNGTPNNALLRMGAGPRPPRCRSMREGEITTDNTPAMRKPKSR